MEDFSGKAHKKTITTVKNTSNNAVTSNLVLKLLYRKAKALEESNNIKEAEVILQKAININSEDNDIKQALKALREKENGEKFK